MMSLLGFISLGVIVRRPNIASLSMLLRLWCPAILQLGKVEGIQRVLLGVSYSVLRNVQVEVVDIQRCYVHRTLI